MSNLNSRSPDGQYTAASLVYGIEGCNLCLLVLCNDKLDDLDVSIWMMALAHTHSHTHVPKLSVKSSSVP